MIEAPVFFPQIGAYVAVDEHVAIASFTPRNRSLPCSANSNGVDLRRVPVRNRDLNARPERAVAFGKAAAVAEFRAAPTNSAWSSLRLALLPAVRWQDPRILADADVVFASARAALEALCCGCAVVVGDYRGMASLVTSATLSSCALEFRA